MKTMFGRPMSPELEAQWVKRSPADRLAIGRRYRQELDAKLSAPLPKPANWDRFSNLDKAQWFGQQKRERAGR